MLGSVAVGVTKGLEVPFSNQYTRNIQSFLLQLGHKIQWHELSIDMVHRPLVICPICPEQKIEVIA